MTYSVGSILRKRLVELGAAGLCNLDNQCGCDLDEIDTCESLKVECEAAKFIKPKSDDRDYWDECPDGYFKPIKVLEDEPKRSI